MRTMYDSVTPSAIPTNAALVAGYVDGAYAWSAANWARFPNSVKVRIAVFPRTNDGHVLDVEQGDATPAQAPGWVTMRRAAGVDPSIYCDASTWPSVVSAFASAGVAAPHYWIAHYDGSAALPAGAVAKQYNDPPASGGNYDISVVADYWPGVDPSPGPAPRRPLERDAMLIIGSANKLRTQAMTDGFTKRNLSPTEAAADSTAFPRFEVDDATWDWLESNTNAMAALLTQPGQLSTDEQALLSAIKAQPTGGQVDEIGRAHV